MSYLQGLKSLHILNLEAVQAAGTKDAWKEVSIVLASLIGLITCPETFKTFLSACSLEPSSD